MCTYFGCLTTKKTSELSSVSSSVAASTLEVIKASVPSETIILDLRLPWTLGASSSMGTISIPNTFATLFSPSVTVTVNVSKRTSDPSWMYLNQVLYISNTEVSPLKMNRHPKNPIYIKTTQHPKIQFISRQPCK